MNLQENPFRQSARSFGLRQHKNLILFGAAGDLSRRKILPSIYGLFHFGLAGSNLSVVGFASSDISEQEFKNIVEESVRAHSETPVDESHLRSMLAVTRYVRRSDDLSASYRALSASMDTNRSPDKLFFMAVPASAALEHAHHLAQHGILEQGENRIVVEKPFGHDRASSAELNASLLQIFSEQDIYRIDHYLGKETVQNILVMRFANQFLEPLLSREHIGHIQVTIAETVGVERRGAYYDSTGALRDMIQNHALQMLSLLTMEPPSSLNSEDIRAAKLDLLRTIRIPTPEQAAEDSAIGRYAGRQPFLLEPGVNPNSRTETYAAIRLCIPNARWDGVPIFIRTGKRLAKRATGITVAFKESCSLLFGNFPSCSGTPNYLTIAVQPNEGASLTLQTKLPGQGFRTRPVTMDFEYNESVAARVPQAYERLLMDAMEGDRTNFAGAEEIDLMWQICEPFTQAWEESGLIPEDYIPGIWGPTSADRLIEKAGARWKRL